MIAVSSFSGGFDLADAVIAILVLVAVLRGVKVGAVMQLLSFGGFWAGLFLGGLVAPSIVHLFHGGVTRAIVAVVVVFAAASILGAGGRVLGASAWRVVRKARLGPLDSVFGGAVGGAASLLAVWVVGGLLASFPMQAVAAQIKGSKVVTSLDRVMPPLPSVWSRVQQFASGTGFPQVFAQVNPATAPPVSEASPAQVAAAVASDGPSMVKVVGRGCGDIQEGSGFVVAPGYVVTNAHVVAGIPSPGVVTRTGVHLAATAVEFDPRFDLAVLQVPGLTEPPLKLDASTVPVGTHATVLGYPGGGPFKAAPAGVRAYFNAVGRDIYGRTLTVREVYEIQAVVIPGNSGGPLVLPDGEVAGVVFSKSATSSNIGYVLNGAGVLSRVKAALAHPHPSGTGACVA